MPLPTTNPLDLDTWAALVRGERPPSPSLLRIWDASARRPASTPVDEPLEHGAEVPRELLAAAVGEGADADHVAR